MRTGRRKGMIGRRALTVRKQRGNRENKGIMIRKSILLILAILVGMPIFGEVHAALMNEDDSSKNGCQGNFENGHEYADLGLPSGLKWALCNIGAERAEDYGDYYAWGEVSPKNVYARTTYKYANGSGNALTTYCNEASYGENGYTDDKTILESGDDAAAASWGGKWRMPTAREFEELVNNCSWTWTTQNGVNGYRVASKTNEHCIFLPAAGYRGGAYIANAGSDGYYWSSSLYEDYPRSARLLYFYPNYKDLYHYGRYFGFSIRPVCP